ncbi:APC membrane recruitment protein 2 [Ambystoma mexicanum]|uniref:APC membrane recruitment protein 2 n=1 Tax=Ambystoma mexicanum TaxID=8296 RepID=UPI0037E82022
MTKARSLSYRFPWRRARAGATAATIEQRSIISTSSCGSARSPRAALTAAPAQGGNQRPLREAPAMDLQDCGAETPDPPPGKMNRTAFKLFVKRRSGSAMPSIFGVRSKGEATKGKGLPRSQTHDGLAAEAGLDSSRKVESTPAEPPLGASLDAKQAPAPSAAPAKAHGFFSLLRKGSGGRGEPAPQQLQGKDGKQRRGGLRGLLSGMQRWRRGPEPLPGEPLSASLTASMERIPEEPPPAPEEEPREPEEDESPLSSLHIEDIIQEAEGRAGEEDSLCLGPEDEEAPVEVLLTGFEDGEEHVGPLEHEMERGPTEHESSFTKEELGPTVDPLPPPLQSGTCVAASEPAPAELPAGLLFADAASLKSFDSLTGCGDITAEPEEERAGEVEDPPPQPEPVAPEPAIRPPTLLIYQGGGEEMASPEGVDDPDLQDFWKALPSPKEQVERSSDSKIQLIKDRDSTAPSPSPVEDSPSPELVNTCHLHEESLPRGTCSGEALYDLFPEPSEDQILPKVDPILVAPIKPLSPVTATCPLKVNTGGLTKDSKIPISRKHLPVHPLPTQAPDPCPQPAQQQPNKSEIPRTKIPVSKVLVRRVSNRVITGTTYKTTTPHDTGRK